MSALRTRAAKGNVLTKLTAMRGYSGSGKSTKAREIATETGAVVVNRDLLRLQLVGEWWTGDRNDEDRVTIAESALATSFLKADTSVVVDATHLNPAYLKKWARISSRLGAEFEVVDVHAPTDVCKQRIYQRWSDAMGTEHARYLDPSVVDQQAKRFPVEKWPVIPAVKPFEVDPVEPRPDLTKAIIVDIDGTVADHEGVRSPFDYTTVSLDRPIHSIIQLVRDWAEVNPSAYVLFVSGRDDSCYADTVKWLTDHEIPFDSLFMRPTGARDANGNKLPDYIVKYDLFNEHIRGTYDVQFVLDDRDQVVDVWRRLGLKCLQVAPGDF